MTWGVGVSTIGRVTSVLSEGGTVTAETPHVVKTLVGFAVFALATVLLPDGVPGLVTAPPVVLALTFVPGGLLLLSLSESVRVNARTVLYAVGLSLVSLLALGFTINLLYPVLGVERPLAPHPLAVSLLLLVGGVAAVALRTHPSGTVTVSVPPLFSPVPLALALLPLWSILAVSYLNRTGDNRPIVVLLAGLALVPVVAVFGLRERWHPFAVWWLALGVIYHKSFWKNFGFSGSPGVIRAWEAQRWSPGVTEAHPYSTELLQNGVLFPTYAWLSGVNIVTELEVVNPFLVAFIPLAVFVAVREYFGSKRALLAGALFVFAHPFYMQYPTAGRAATPVLFLSLFALVLSDAEASPLRASVLGLSFASGIVVTHYGTSYFVMVAVLGALLLLQVLYFTDRTFADRLGSFATDGGAALDRVVSISRVRNRKRVLSTTLVLYYSVSAIGWYLYATQGQKFKTLPNHVVSTIQTLLSGGIVSGRTGARVVRNYGSTSIRLAKLIYIMFGLLMGIGFLYAYYCRVVRQDRSLVDDRYLALASLMLALFALTFVARNWGGGRPMMITFTITAGFAVLGAAVVGRSGVRAVRDALGHAGHGVGRLQGVRAGFVLFAVLLVLLFSLNSGLAAVLVLDGRSPSNVPWEPAQESHRSLDTDTHVWINNYGSGQVYGDPITHGQTDWYLPDIEIRTDGHRAYGESLNKPRGQLLTLREPGVEHGYVMLLSHNTEEQSIVRPYTTRDYPLSKFRSELRPRNRIYTTGLSQIYYTAEPSGDSTAEEG